LFSVEVLGSMIFSFPEYWRLALFLACGLALSGQGVGAGGDKSGNNRVNALSFRLQTDW